MIQRLTRAVQSALNTVLTGLSVAISTDVTATDTILVAIGKLQAKLTANAALILRSALTADFTTTSASAVDVTGTAGALVTVTLAANGVYRITSDAIYQSAATNTGCLVTFSFTNSPTIALQQTRTIASAGTSSGTLIVASDGGAATTATTDAATNLTSQSRGLVIVGGSASVMTMRVLRGGTSNNITIKAGSMILATRIA